MLVAASADNHFNINSRWDECTRIHRFIADDMDQRGVDLFCAPGDFFERASKPVERNGVRELLQRIAENRPVIGVRGNHDSLEDLAIYNHIRSKWPITIEEGASVRPVQTPAGVAMVACVAWPRKAQLLSMLGNEVSRQDSELEVREQLRILMLGLRTELLKHDGPRILVMHAMLCGARTSIGQPLVGCDLEVSEQELALTEADVILLGHVHKPQETEYNGIPIIYTGSPYATEYGETEDKSYVIVEFADKRDVQGKILKTWYRVPTPRTPMVLLNARYLPDRNEFYYSSFHSNTENFTADDGLFDWSKIPGADVRFRYTVNSDDSDSAKRAALRKEQELLSAGAVAVKVESVLNPTTRARAPEMSEAQSMSDELQIYWSRRNVEPDRVKRLLAKHGQIETELRDGA